jgi:hypothetical protein
VRFVLPLLAAVVLIVPVACGGGDDTASDTTTTEQAPLTLSQRLVTAEDAPGSKPDPVEQGGTTVKFDEFIQTLGELAVDPDTKEVTALFKEAGFKGAGSGTRFFGKTHTPTQPHVFSSVIQLQSEEGATNALDWLETDSLKPCPMSCAVQRSNFDVDDIPGARGVHRSATADDIARVGTPDERPFDSYWVGFTDGSFVYTVELHGPPGSVTEEQVLKIAHAHYERLKGN